MAGQGTSVSPFALAPNESATELILCVEPCEKASDTLANEILQVAAKMRVTAPVDAASVRATIAQASKGERARAVVAKGKQVVHGVDGRLIWSKRITSSQSEQGGRLSHYVGRLEKRIVKRDDPLAKVVPETDGTDGVDVFGRTVKAHKGKPLKIAAGANVREKDGIFYAAKDGCVACDKGKIRVEEVLYIEGDVDFETGNIDFPGAVAVKGGVLDLFRIKAGGAVEVNGLVEAAAITAVGDVEMQGGVEGKKKGVILSRGNVSAKFLVNAEVQARKDVCVETQIISSKVMSLGAVKAPEGAIAGGEVTALAGVDAETIGSETAVPTAVTAGVNYTLAGLTKAAQKIAADSQGRLDIIGAELKAIDAKPLTDETKAKRAALNEEKSSIEKAIESAAKRRDDGIDLVEKAARPVIVVRKVIYPGAVIRLGNCRTTINEAIAGPLKLVPDKATGTVRFVALGD